ncbi:hypothetical protein [Leptospira sp. GIMC2001]|uniref:hypothetical protein n=1 Tax=Leptospira sp. GIMC2001 TaxID=1513297 RepID=UPI002349C975|nr:hypothetical protein [Leptospira sp. GIMC2001]WCL49485.1 hypothetical protein O4O04_19685 [Leptospira sp. GIMC2001]
MLIIKLVQIFLTIFLTGLIWTIQLVHYPSFNDVGKNEFIQFHKNHTTRISILVIPFMICELLISIAWLVLELNQFSIVNASLVLLIWLATFLISVPIHNALVQNFNLVLIQKLNQTNWIRTILWSLKSFLLLGYFFISIKQLQ